MMSLRTWRKACLTGISILLSLPLLAMAFTHEVNWGAMDFVMAAGLLTFAGLGVEAAWRSLPSGGPRLAGAAAVLVAAGIVWAHLAVGVF